MLSMQCHCRMVNFQTIQDSTIHRQRIYEYFKKFPIKLEFMVDFNQLETKLLIALNPVYEFFVY